MFITEFMIQKRSSGESSLKSLLMKKWAQGLCKVVMKVRTTQVNGWGEEVHNSGDTRVGVGQEEDTEDY